jgi:hypothetical protein
VIRLVCVAALALLVPGVLMLVLSGLILRGRRAALPSGAELRRRRLGTHLAGALERETVTRETHTREPVRSLERPSARLQKLWDERIKPAIAAELEARAAMAERAHPEGWTPVVVSGVFTAYTPNRERALCAVAPDGRVALFSRTGLLWFEVARTGHLADVARAALGRST